MFLLYVICLATVASTTRRLWTLSRVRVLVTLRKCPIALLVAVKVLVASAAIGATANELGRGAQHANVTVGPLIVSKKTTWITAEGPEIQVLIENPTTKPVDFSVEFPSDSAAKFRACLEGRGWKPDRALSAVHATGNLGVSHAREWIGGTAGSIPSNSWIHWTFAIGSELRTVGCVVELTVSATPTGQRAATRSIPVTIQGPADGYLTSIMPFADTSSMPAVLDVSTTVRENEWGLPSARIVRTLVRNNSKGVVQLSSVMTGFGCHGVTKAWTPLVNEPGVIQGLDSGPVRVEPEDWVVFTRAFRVMSRHRNGDCNARFVVSARHGDGVPIGSRLVFARF